MNVAALWNSICEKGYLVRKQEQDGLKMWQPLKNHFSCYEISGHEIDYPQINDKIFELSHDVDYLFEDTDHNAVTININGTLLTNSKESDHFVIQHLRIPKMLDYRLPLVKILQIAYNVGQASAEFEKDTYHEDVKKFYNDNRLSEINSFIDKEISLKSIVKV